MQGSETTEAISSFKMQIETNKLLMFRYLKIFGLFIKIGLMRQMAYRPHFFMMVAGKVIRIVLIFFFFQAIFLKVDSIGQWRFDQVLLLFATFHIVDFLTSILFQRNLIHAFPRWVQTGELDTRLLLPVNHLFWVSFENIDLMDFFSFIPSLAFLGYVIISLSLNFELSQILIYGILIINAIIFVYSINLIIASISFWTVQSFGIGRIMDNIFKIGRYPLDIFDGFWKIVFIYFFPLVVIAQLPVQAFLKILSFRYILFAFFISGIFMFIAISFWKKGVKNYLSASI